jgi:prolyl-tRNA editing enzyme YbaK/EbsC (Cys-tRNA(Pro) deacylase)
MINHALCNHRIGKKHLQRKLNKKTQGMNKLSCFFNEVVTRITGCSILAVNVVGQYYSIHTFYRHGLDFALQSV